MSTTNQAALASTWVGMCDEYDAVGNRTRRFKLMEIRYANGAQIVDERYFQPDGTADYRYEYVYAPGGALAEKRMVLGEAHEHGRWVYTSEGRRIVSAVWFNERGQAEAADTYTYAADGRTALRIRTNVGEWRHEYDDAGREVRVSGGPYSGAGVEIIDYVHDEDGYLLVMEQRGFVRRVITFMREPAMAIAGSNGSAP